MHGHFISFYKFSSLACIKCCHKTRFMYTSEHLELRQRLEMSPNSWMDTPEVALGLFQHIELFSIS